jgi:hypothetical protein
MSTTISPSVDTSIQKDRQRQKARSAKTDRPKDGSTVKATIVMDRKLHCLLSSIARFQDMDGSELAVELIEKGLKGDRYAGFVQALDPFTPKVRKKAKADGPGDNSESDA